MKRVLAVVGMVACLSLASVLPAAGAMGAQEAKALIGKAMAIELGEKLSLPAEDLRIMLDEYSNFVEELGELQAERAAAKQALSAAVEAGDADSDVLDLLDTLMGLDEEIAALPVSYAEAYMSDLSGAQLAHVYLFLADFDENIAAISCAAMCAAQGCPMASATCGATCGAAAAQAAPEEAAEAAAEEAAPAASPEEAALAAAKAWGEALASQDMDKIMAVFADDFEHYEYGDKQGISDFISQAVDMGYLEDLEIFMDDAEVEIDGEEVIVYPVELMGAFGSVTFELVFEDRDGKMLITTMDASGI
jgi:hypothetical protein